MKPANGSHTLASNGQSQTWTMTSTGATSSFDTWTYDATLDLYVADHHQCVVKFVDSTNFRALVGTPPNYTIFNGTYS